MNTPASVVIHPSQFPGAVANDLLKSLREKRVNHKFHYDSIKQTRRWLALHQAFSPSRTDANCAAIYDQSFEHLQAILEANDRHLVGLGCGGGQKDSRLLRRLVQNGSQVHYTPMDVSVAMVLVAREAALEVVKEECCHPFVCDLAEADGLREAFDPKQEYGSTRLYTFFGMIPNFEPGFILKKLGGLIGQSDNLLFSANLAPGVDYSRGVRQVLPLYDNDLTREWLETFLRDLGVEKADGGVSFGIETDPDGGGLEKIVGRFRFAKRVQITVEGETFEFPAGDSIQLFFSYRHSPASVRRLLSAQGLEVRKEWLADSGEEGVFHCVRV